ncbi:MAG: hypothetical protein ACREPV_04805 [Lysobacter sp.]
MTWKLAGSASVSMPLQPGWNTVRRSPTASMMVWRSAALSKPSMLPKPM